MAAAAISKNLSLASGAVTGALSAPTSTAITTLTQAQILGMFASPVVLVPAAPGVINFPLSILAVLRNPGPAAPFAGGGGLRIGNPAFLFTLAATAGTLTTANESALSSLSLSLGTTEPISVVNAPIVLTNATAALTGGAATSSLFVQVTYVAVSIA